MSAAKHGRQPYDQNWAQQVPDIDQYRRPSGGGYQSAPGRDIQMPRRKSRKWPWVVLVVVILLLAAGGAFGYFAYNGAKDLKVQAQTALEDVNQIAQAVKDNSFEVASEKSVELKKVSASMKSEMDGPLWSVASIVPVYGGDVAAVKTVVGVLDDVSSNALVPLLSTLQENPIASLVQSDHSVNVASASSLLSAIESAAPVFDRCAKQIDKMPSLHVDQLQKMIGPVKEKMASVNETVQNAAELAPVFGSVLGVNGDRNYLIVAQNSSEIRSLGGFPGSVGTMSIVNGKISMNDFVSCYKVFDEGLPASVAATEQELRMFNSNVAKFSKTWDSGLDPDFPRVASIWAESYKQKNGVAVDGVIGVTPSMVQRILKITEGITISDGTLLHGANATRVLQHDLYEKYYNNPDTAERANAITDDLFAETAKKAFDKLFQTMNGSTMKASFKMLLDAASTREMMVWFTNEGEQKVSEDMGASGSLESVNANHELGVFYNDTTGSKLGWYMDIDSVIGEGKKQADGSAVYSVKTKVANTITPEEGSSSVAYIVNDHGRVFYNLYLYAPAGGRIENLKTSNGMEMRSDNHCGRDVFYVQDAKIMPLESAEITYDVIVPAGAEPLVEVKTPTLTQYRK